LNDRIAKNTPAARDVRRLWLMVGASLFAGGYALLAGLRTLSSFDLGWQLATGRWISQHHEIPGTELFSYTASGGLWIYPVLSEAIFYLTYRLGGYSLLSWLGALVCVAVAVILLWRGTPVTAWLLILVLPLIAKRCTPRADIFTLLFFVLFVAVLWQKHRIGSGPIWLLPIAMVLWVNLHLGFPAGLAAIGIYAVAKCIGLRRHDGRRPKRIEDLKQAALLLGLSVVATFLNPWGWEIYLSLRRQAMAMTFTEHQISEWTATPISWESAASVFHLRDGSGALFQLLAVSSVALVIALYRRQWGSSLILAAAALVAIRYVRFQALSACLIVIVAGWLFSSYFDRFAKGNRTRTAVFLILYLGFSTLAVLRSIDLVSNRAYLSSSGITAFGSGLSWWFPEDAASFIEREKIPPQLFNSFNLGGYLTWRLGPIYPDYIDGRYLPFSPDIFLKQKELMNLPPNSPEWKQESERRGIHSVILSLARYDGLQFFPFLSQFCQSDVWAPVYLDDVSAVFVRRSPDTEPLIQRLRIDCFKAPFPAKELSKDRVQRFNQWANAAAILMVLGRSDEAIAATDHALAIFDENGNLHYIRGKALAASGRSMEALKEYRAAVQLEPNESAYVALAQIYRKQGDGTAAAEAFVSAAHISSDPHLIYLSLAYTLLDDKHPKEALRAFGDAVRTVPPSGSTVTDSQFSFSVAHGRALALFALGNIAEAIPYQEEAIRESPERVDLWLELSTFYELNGRREEAQQARSHAAVIDPRVAH